MSLRWFRKRSISFNSTVKRAGGSGGGQRPLGLSRFAGVVLQEIERPANDGIVFGRKLIKAERRRRLVFASNLWRSQGHLRCRHDTIFENGFVFRRVVVGDCEHQRSPVFERNDLLFRSSAEGALANQISA